MSPDENFVFRIPDRLEELEDNENFPNYYTIKNSYRVDELPSLIDTAIRKYKSDGPDFIFENFDIFYFTIVHFKSLDSSARNDAWSILFKAVTQLHNQLSAFFDDFQMDQRLYIQNKLQMILYVFLQLCERCETNDGDEDTSKRKKKVNVYDVYTTSRNNYMSVLFKIFAFRMDRLFQPAHFLNSFVNIVTRLAYKILETCSRVRNQVLFQLIGEIICVAIEKYDHVSNYCMKIIELLQSKESLAPTVANLVIFNVKHSNHHWLISDILVQIKAIDVNELCRDSSAPRAISTFLICVAESCMEEMMKCMSDLLEFLDQDSYLLRNAALEIISMIIIQRLQVPLIRRDELIKMKLLENLENHIHDNTSYTRSKVLQLWCNLSQNQAIPISQLNNVVRLIIDRLDDKSCFVRKNAVHFLSSTLNDNPFTIVNKKELLKLLNIAQNGYDSYRKNLEELLEDQEEQFNEILSIGNMINKDDYTIIRDESDSEDVTNQTGDNDNNICSKRKSNSPSGKKKQKFDYDAIMNLGNQWKEVEQSFFDYWKKKGQSLDFGNGILDEMPQENFKKGYDFFCQMVTEKKFELALKALFALKNLYPTESVFQLNQNVDSNEDEDDSNEGRNSADSADYLDNIFFSYITHSSSKNCAKLPSELKLARHVFLAPLIKWSKSECEKKEIHVNMLTQKNEEILNQQKTVEQYKAKFLQYENLIKRLNTALEFFNLISNAIPKICTLLNSRNITDVQEAINFFTHAFRMEIENSVIGVQKMLKLIFTKEKTIKDALLDAFIGIYLKDLSEENENDEEDVEDETGNKKKSIAAQEVRNMSNMILRLDQGELISAEKLIKDLYASKKFDQIHLRILWERYAMKLANTSLEESRAALLLIGMIADAEPSLIRNETNLNNIISISLENRKDDYRLVADSCMVLLKAFKLPSTELMEHFFKLQPDHILFQRLKTILIDSINGVENNYWYQMASSILTVIYFLSEKPDYIVTEIIHDCYANIVSTSNCSSDTQTDLSSTGQNISDVSVDYFLFLLGEVAIKMLIHLDLHVMKEIKIRQFIKEKEQTEKKNSLKNKRKSLLDKSSVNSELEEVIGPDNNEDPYLEQISKICNDEVLFKNGILSKFSTMVENIASDYYGDKYSLRVRRSASLTMAKFMTLSMKYARKNRVILADILEKSKDCSIRSNAIVSFGDLLLRFPNEIEHYTGKIFSCLDDKELEVKRNSLKVLGRLVLADMIKPKGHISKIAALVTDAEKCISMHARLFFIELGKKNNAYIYNFLPDIISNLSGEKGLQEDRFQEMIKFLFELLEKTRNTESLVTKLCSRFHNTNDERTWRDLSFCLSQLQYNDRAFYNLMSSFNLFSDTLYCDAIHDNIMSIITNIRKAGNLKNETKNLIDEMEAKISDARSKGSAAQQNNDDDEQAMITDQLNGVDVPSVLVNRFKRIKVESAVKKSTKKSTKRVDTTIKKKVNTRTAPIRRSKRRRNLAFCDSDDNEDSPAHDDDQYDFDDD